MQWFAGGGRDGETYFVVKIKVILFVCVFTFFYLQTRANFPTATFLKAFFFSSKTGAGLENKQANPKSKLERHSSSSL